MLHFVCELISLFSEKYPQFHSVTQTFPPTLFYGVEKQLYA